MHSDRHCQNASLELSQQWGGGGIASADGLCFVVPVKSIHSGPNQKYFCPKRGITYFTLVSDQFTVLNGQIIPGTIRDSLYILASLLEQQTSLRPQAVMTDTASYTDVIFGLYFLLGYKFCPRLKDVGGAKFWRINREAKYGALTEVARGKINTNVIVQQWDDVLRLIGSVKLSKIRVVDVMRVLSRDSAMDGLGKAVQEIGRIAKTIYLLEYISDEAFQRAINNTLNHGETRNSMARNLAHGQRGEIRQHYRQGMENQLGALGFMLNVLVLWNTEYIQASLDLIKAMGDEVLEEDVIRISPLKWAHIGMLEKYEFTMSPVVAGGDLRPLRDPDAGRILASSFSNAACQPISDGLAKADVSGVHVMTLHRLAKLVLEEAMDLGLAQALRFDAGCEHSIAGEVLRGRITRDELLSLVGLTKAHGLSVPDGSPDAVESFRAFELERLGRGVRGFADLVPDAVRTLEESVDLLAAMQARFACVIVDEFQDVNLKQSRLVALIGGHGNLMIVGDANQTIFRFQGASPEFFTGFSLRHAGAVRFEFRDNFRCGAAHILVANDVIEHNASSQSPAVPVRGFCGQIALHRGSSISGIVALEAEQFAFSDMAILVRNYRHSLALEADLIRDFVPYSVVGGTALMDRVEVKRVFQLIFELSSGVMRSGLSKYLTANGRDGSESIRVAGLDKRLCEALQPWRWLKPLTPEVILALKSAFIGRGSFEIMTGEGVQILSIHRSKGLQWPVVLIPNVDEGTFPAASKGADLEGERRLFYVAVTRCQESLHILASNPSRFFDEGLIAENSASTQRIGLAMGRGVQTNDELFEIAASAGDPVLERYFGHWLEKPRFESTRAQIQARLQDAPLEREQRQFWGLSTAILFRPIRAALAGMGV